MNYYLGCRLNNYYISIYFSCCFNFFIANFASANEVTNCANFNKTAKSSSCCNCNATEINF